MYCRTEFLRAAAISVIALALTQGAHAAEKPYRLGFMIWSSSTPFSSALIKSARDEAKAEGVALDIQGGNADLPTQISVIQQFIAQKVDAILVNASDPKGIVPAIRQANAAGIPVLAVNQGVDTSTGAKIVTYVGVDDFTFGQQQGELVAKAIGGKGSVAYIMGVLGTTPQLQRKAGLEDTLKKYPDVKIVDSRSASWDNAKALEITQDYLSKYPQGMLAAVLDQGPEGVSGAAFAAKQGRADVKVLLGDYPSDVNKAIAAGTVYGTVNQDPVLQGVAGVKDAVLWLDGKKEMVPAPNHYMELPIVTKDNVEKYPASW
jgi:ribose transport system substrate-binding protein